MAADQNHIHACLEPQFIDRRLSQKIGMSNRYYRKCSLLKPWSETSTLPPQVITAYQLPATPTFNKVA